MLAVNTMIWRWTVSYPGIFVPNCLARLLSLRGNHAACSTSVLSGPLLYLGWRMAKADSRSVEAAAYRKLYKTARWQRIRSHQLSMHPLCEWCLEREDVTEATEVHHAIAHKGDMMLFWSGPFVSTCKPCHSSRGQLEDHGKTVVVYGADGWPV